MADPITTDDLYGASNGASVKIVPPSDAQTKNVPLDIPIEETPEILPDEPTQTPIPVSNEGVVQETKKGVNFIGIFAKIILFLVLFTGGIWLSRVIRPYAQPELIKNNPTPTINNTPEIRPTDTLDMTNLSDDAVITTSEPTATPAQAVTWKTYNVISGAAKVQFAGSSFKLPPDVLSPVCDGSICSSQGTYLPGGTRFTVAPRGAGQVLADFRGTAISDVGGITFTTKETLVAGLPAMEFTGSFTGRTVSGYGFSSMRGVMIEVTPTTSLEMNHFTPNGIVADFASDDALFDEILKTVIVARLP